ncbi:MAG TPA: lysophospholipid acyltransferase family protein [Streptosporangiaceae bacterium]|nr:lysophospholipid acyltransferase family protein [Streptosporangiaceae bacterium]
MFYWVVKAILGPFLRIVFRPWADGIDNVPREGPAIIASNHLSFSDHFFAPLPLPRKVVFLAKSEYFTGRGLKGLVSKAFFSGVGQIPVDRSGGAASERALRTGLRVLAQGDLLGIYPEGTRTPDGRLYRGKTGVARLALEARAPVVPCAMIGGFEFQPPGKIRPRLRIRPGARFGKPLDFSRYYGMEQDRVVLRAVTDEVMYAIMKLSGQEYVDQYAQRSKHGMPLGLRRDASDQHAAEGAATQRSGPERSGPERSGPQRAAADGTGPDGAGSRQARGDRDRVQRDGAEPAGTANGGPGPAVPQKSGPPDAGLDKPADD